MKKVLVVDDDPDVLAAIGAVIKRAGYEVFPLESGRAALDWIELHVPDLVLLDVVMPELSGFETCRAIRAHADPVRSLVPIIFLTSKNAIADMVEGRAAGSDTYLTKPVLSSKLLKTVEIFLGGDFPLRRKAPSPKA